MTPMPRDTLPQCTTCRIHKPLTEYWRDSSRKNGRNYVCISCCKIQKENYKRSHIVARSIALHPQKQKARLLIRKLLKSGELLKLACFLCGDSKSVAHHINYKYPDKVIWLCVRHHSEVHHA
jgi:hypothetical protein